MFEPEECIGIEATDYLNDQGFIAWVESEYGGPDDIITDGKLPTQPATVVILSPPKNSYKSTKVNKFGLLV